MSLFNLTLTLFSLLLSYYSSYAFTIPHLNPFHPSESHQIPLTIQPFESELIQPTFNSLPAGRFFATINSTTITVTTHTSSTSTHTSSTHTNTNTNTNTNTSTTHIPGPLLALIDPSITGLSPIPPPLVDAVYSAFPGAVKVYANVSAMEVYPRGVEWLVPCPPDVNVNVEVEVVFEMIFGRTPIPIRISQRDLVQSHTVTIQDDEDDQPFDYTFCSNVNGTTVLDERTFDGYDVVLGESFVRSMRLSDG
ncbi:hypothetical protein ONZ45_g12169 [Pleurotus djamor]|nr:hypothetical protein ONZ45_g12169 [Pleurotus djamor]